MKLPFGTRLFSAFGGMCLAFVAAFMLFWRTAWMQSIAAVVFPVIVGFGVLGALWWAYDMFRTAFTGEL